MTQSRILPLSPEVLFRTLNLTRDQLIYTLFLIEEGTNALYFLVRSAAYTKPNGNIRAGKIATKLIPELLDQARITGRFELPSGSGYPDYTQNQGNETIATIANIEAAGRALNTAVYGLTYGGSIAFNFYFRSALDFMITYSIPWHTSTNRDPWSNPQSYWNGTTWISISDYLRPQPQTLTRITLSFQLTNNYSAFLMFIYEEAFQMLQYNIRYLINLGSKESRALTHAGRLANWYMDDLLGLISWTANPLFGAITKGVSYIGFNSYFRALFQLLKLAKQYYHPVGTEPLGEWEYWGDELTVRKTIDAEGLALTSTHTMNPLSQTIIKRA